jgi:hypothetical protein
VNGGELVRRAGLIVAFAIPLSMLFAFTGMWRFGIVASLLSLGAIDFGLVVDCSVVMVENCVRHLSEANPLNRSRLGRIRDAAVEVRGPTMFGELIIMIVYLPILTLEGIEGKMFRPMALNERCATRRWSRTSKRRAIGATNTRDPSRSASSATLNCSTSSRPATKPNSANNHRNRPSKN